MSRKPKSAFSKALGRELGKNTGKFVSNKVFGDGHSTPHRVKIQREKTEQLKQETKNQQAQILNTLESEIDNKIQELSLTPLPNDEKDMVKFLLELELLLKSNSWKGIGINGDEKHKITNKYADGLFEKYQQGVEFLQLQSATPETISKFQTKIKKFRKKRIFGKFWFPILLFSLISIVLILAILFA